MTTTEEQSDRIDAYIARETIVSAVINSVIGALFFLAVFSTAGRVAVRNWGGYAFDFLPQSAAVALMACLVPGLITRRAQLAGRLPAKGRSTTPVRWLVRAAFAAVLSALTLGTGIACLWLASSIATLDWPIALVIKIIYGAALGAWVTRCVLRRMIVSAPLI